MTLVEENRITKITGERWWSKKSRGRWRDELVCAKNNKLHRYAKERAVSSSGMKGYRKSIGNEN